MYYQMLSTVPCHHAIRQKVFKYTTQYYLIFVYLSYYYQNDMVFANVVILSLNSQNVLGKCAEWHVDTALPSRMGVISANVLTRAV